MVRQAMSVGLLLLKLPMNKRPFSARMYYAPMVVILILAAGLRWMNTGLERLSTDEAVHTLKAIAVARHGKLELLGPPMPYFNFRGWHGPVSIYIYALPMLIKPDPRLARMMTGVVHIVATALIFALGSRFFGRRSGVISAFLFAVHPEAVYLSRGIWNPMLQIPFALAYVWTGLLGYSKGNKWARIANLPMLTLGGQCHPGVFLLAPISVVLWVSALWRNDSARRSVVRHTIVGAVLALFLTIPWMVGVYLDNVNDIALREIKGVELIQAGTGLEDRIHLHMLTRMYQQLGNWERNWTQPVQPLITTVGLVVLVAAAIVRRGRVAGGVVSLGYVLPPLLLLAIGRYEDHFIWSGYGFAFIVQGVMVGMLMVGGKTWVGGASQEGRGYVLRNICRCLLFFVLCLLILKQILFNLRYDLGLGRISLDEQVAAIDIAAARARTSDRGVLLLASDDWMRWESLREGRDARVVRPDRALPLPADGAILLGRHDYYGRPNVFSGGEVLQSGFRLAELHEAAYFQPDVFPLDPVRFSNGATILGFLRDDSSSFPMPGQSWTVFMIWRVDKVSSADYTVFAHLVDNMGVKYSQVDMPALPVGQQRIGESVMNRMEFVIDEGLPDDTPLFLHFGMYNDEHSATVLGVDGESADTLGVIQIKARDKLLVRWDDFAIVDVVSPGEFELGRPFEVLVTWRFMRTPAEDMMLLWRLISDTGVVVYETETEIVPGRENVSLPDGLLTTIKYSLPIGDGITTGNYNLEILLVAPDGQQKSDSFGTSVEIVSSTREFSVSEIQNPLQVDYSGTIALLGYDMWQSGERIDLTLYWRAQRQIEKDYKYFVHLWGEGKIVAQVDAMPLANQYPTSWWAAGEVVREEVQLYLPDSGEYMLTTGFYDPVSNKRLPTVSINGRTDFKEWADLSSIEMP